MGNYTRCAVLLGSLPLWWIRIRAVSKQEHWPYIEDLEYFLADFRVARTIDPVS